MKQLIQMMKRKWIDGECRHLCAVCPFWKPHCKINFFPISRKCAKPYDAGFKDGYDYAKKMYK